MKDDRKIYDVALDAIDSYRNGSRVLILGDLAIDLMIVTETRFSDSNSGGDLTFLGSPTWRVGGTAFVFASAIKQYTQSSPQIIANVGNDSFGELIKSTVRAERMSISGIQTTASTQSQFISTIYCGDGKRIMAMGERKLFGKLDARKLDSLLSSVDPKSCKVLFVSGYLLAGGLPINVDAIRVATHWAYNNGIPIMFDLVPHAFLENVGDLDFVRECVQAPITAYVAELQTARGLGIGADSDVDDSYDQLADAASAMAREATFAIVQHQVAADVYLQAFAIRGRACEIETWEFDPSDRYGLGDRMLVAELQRRGRL